MTFDEASQPGGASSSHKVHVPVAVIGIVGYALMLGFALAGFFRVVRELALVGFMSACFLTYLEAYVLEKWCIYCVWSQAIVTVLLIAATLTVAWMSRRASGSTRAHAA